ncbi:uncharacterized protein LTR77_005411 [Saxophila tyrrhenica]|uniref:Uncharacterized protein n=1 Tax=Saxophila tyrrhenica TaxID=1690608 RepID=A0AAV9PCM8_9PEZI|nr:hypothetical protein LTR77_005411 [Saxophila tyrrhenica]
MRITDLEACLGLKACLRHPNDQPKALGNLYRNIARIRGAYDPIWDAAKLRQESDRLFELLGPDLWPDPTTVDTTSWLFDPQVDNRKVLWPGYLVYGRARDHNQLRAHFTNILYEKCCNYTAGQRKNNQDDKQKALAQPDRASNHQAPANVTGQPTPRNETAVAEDSVADLADNVSLATISPKRDAGVVYPEQSGDGLEISDSRSLSRTLRSDIDRQLIEDRVRRGTLPAFVTPPQTSRSQRQYPAPSSSAADLTQNKRKYGSLVELGASPEALQAKQRKVSTASDYTPLKCEDAANETFASRPSSAAGGRDGQTLGSHDRPAYDATPTTVCKGHATGVRDRSVHLTTSDVGVSHTPQFRSQASTGPRPSSSYSNHSTGAAQQNMAPGHSGESANVVRQTPPIATLQAHHTKQSVSGPSQTRLEHSQTKLPESTPRSNEVHHQEPTPSSAITPAPAQPLPRKRLNIEIRTTLHPGTERSVKLQFRFGLSTHSTVQDLFAAVDHKMGGLLADAEVRSLSLEVQQTQARDDHLGTFYIVRDGAQAWQHCVRGLARLSGETVELLGHVGSVARRRQG